MRLLQHVRIAGVPVLVATGQHDALVGERKAAAVAALFAGARTGGFNKPL